MSNIQSALQQVQDLTLLPMHDIHCRLIEGGYKLDVSIPSASLLLTENSLAMPDLVDVQIDDFEAHLIFNLH